jgi:hypothetical protein
VCGQEASTPFKFSLSSIENNFVELTYKVSQDFMDNLFLASTMAVSLFAAKCYNDVSFAETSGELASNLHKQFV